ncbi:hypothetical protein J2Y45_003071 [Dyadobacter sp. BE34]|uniref:Uncharacterized protein n=1 Tax=Dyadobacter fermentans TaxID=94254 RepID=A0ABU1QU03_9BACT|nr:MULTISPECIES: hypothetical protein [Dyadobacter]MDR6804621.1 hypothetical protein [Dyadobacter fermentans]MDR7043620.1 hypothetical protein [Dyadobacter sp. BE242]MDR7197932.1 hypothetical protein [Dyadobacter sp. BE34]MDR7214635.1 hypothetical protein [Dyadobacter sp. BE31]MDR7262170.1 hypothetical protein [Dyadobacter sp. BE32]
MNVALSAEISADIRSSNPIHTLAGYLTRHFRDRHYGDDVEEFIVGIICTRPELDFFFKVRGLKYIAHKTITHDGISVIAHKSLSYDVKIDYSAFLAGNESERIALLAKSLVDSLSILTKMPKKVKQFDVASFQHDMTVFLNDPSNLAN